MKDVRVQLTVTPQAAVLAGHGRYGLSIIAVDAANLTPDQAATLARHVSFSFDHDAFMLDEALINNGVTNTEDIGDFNEANVLRAIDKLTAVMVDRSAKTQLLAEEGVRHRRQAAEAMTRTDPSEMIEMDRKLNAYQLKLTPAVTAMRQEFPEIIQPWLNNLADAVVSRNQQLHAEAERAALVAACSARHNHDGRDILSGWIKTNGSKLLQARAAHGYNYLDLAEEEMATFLAVHILRDVYNQWGWKFDSPTVYRCTEFTVNKTMTPTDPDLIQKAVEIQRCINNYKCCRLERMECLECGETHGPWAESFLSNFGPLGDALYLKIKLSTGSEWFCWLRPSIAPNQPVPPSPGHGFGMGSTPMENVSPKTCGHRVGHQLD